VADYFRRIALARAEWRDGNVGRVEPLLEGCPKAMRQWEWHYLKRLCHQDILTLRRDSFGLTCVAFSPDGKWIAAGEGVSRSPAEVAIWDAETGEIIRTLVGHTLPLTSVAFSPDGRRLVSGSEDCTVRIWDATPMGP